MNFIKSAAVITLAVFSFSFPFSLKSRAFTLKRAGVFYFKEPFGIVHQKANLESPSIKVIFCGQPLEVLEPYGQKSLGDWSMVKRRKLEGFIQTKFLSKRWPKCFTRTYSQFIGEFQMSKLTFTFGKYVEQVRRGRSKSGSFDQINRLILSRSRLSLHSRRRSHIFPHNIVPNHFGPRGVRMKVLILRPEISI